MKNDSIFQSWLLAYTLFAMPIFLPAVSAQSVVENEVYTFKADSVSISELEYLLFILINQKRIENRLQPLIWNEQATQIARLHSRNMADYDFFGHEGLDGRKVDGRANLFGLRRWQIIGENIAYNRGYRKPLERVVESWMRSAGHRRNLLNRRWKESGIGIAIKSNRTYYFTQVFLIRK